MATLYIDQNNYRLSHDNGRLLIQGEQFNRGLPLSSFDRLVIQGRNQIDTALLHALNDHAISVVCLHPRHPRKTAHIGANQHAQARRRLGQYALLMHHPDTREQLAGRLVQAKLRGQARLLQTALVQRPDLRRPLTAALATLRPLIDCLHAQVLPLERLRGIEGAGAHAYFAGYRTLFAPTLGFTHRNRRPPRDPVNAALSLGYTLLHHDAVNACHQVGLDPLLGYYHDLSYNRESLACDLVEPLRPAVDEWVCHLFQSRTLRAEHFTTHQPGCLLDKAGRQHFYRSWEGFVPPLRRHMRLHGYRLVRQLEPLAPAGQPEPVAA